MSINRNFSGWMERTIPEVVNMGAMTGKLALDLAV